MRHNNKPNLLLLTSSFPRSPDDETCGYVRDFARSLAGEFNVTVLAPSDRGATRWPVDAFVLVRSRSVLPARFDHFQATADLNELLSSGRLTWLATTVSLLCFFARAFVLALRADAICSHWLVPAGLVGALISRVTGKPHVVVEHSGALHFLARVRGGRSIARLIVRGSDRVVTVSENLKRKLITLCAEADGKAEVIPMGVGSILPPRQTASTRPDCDSAPHTILFIGRLAEIKGLDVLLKAMSGLDGLRLIVAGDGVMREHLERMSRELSVEAVFLGHVDSAERRSLLSVCDVVVIPSRVLGDGRTEGTPVVCLESFAAGRAVVASRVGGLSEIIVDGKNGLLFDPDHHVMLRNKLTLVLKDPVLRSEISENARRAASAYSWSSIGPRFVEVIRRSLRRERVKNVTVIERPCGLDHKHHA